MELTLVKKDEIQQTYRNEEQVNEVTNIIYTIKENGNRVGDVSICETSVTVNLSGMGRKDISEYDALVKKMFKNLTEKA